MTENMKLWNAVEKTPPDHCKPITGKQYNGTSPKPHFLVMKATEIFGPAGIGWGFTIVDERIEDGLDGERMSIAKVRVWYEWNGKRGEVEHIGGTPFAGRRKSGQTYMDEDAPKKSVTDALVKALSMIGFAGDIFLGRYDDSKYVNELRQEEREEKRAEPKADNKEGGKPTASSKAPEDRKYNEADIKAMARDLKQAIVATQDVKSLDTVMTDWRLKAIHNHNQTTYDWVCGEANAHKTSLYAGTP